MPAYHKSGKKYFFVSGEITFIEDEVKNIFTTIYPILIKARLFEGSNLYYVSRSNFFITDSLTACSKPGYSFEIWRHNADNWKKWNGMEEAILTMRHYKYIYGCFKGQEQIVETVEARVDFEKKIVYAGSMYFKFKPREKLEKKYPYSFIGL